MGSPSLEHVRFDTAGYEPRGDIDDHTRAWYSPDGDVLGVFLFLKEPDVPRVSTLGELRRWHTERLRRVGGDSVELAIVSVDDVRALQTIVKVPQAPSGRTYLASLILPFAEFSFVLKVQCEEHGITGMREAMLLHDQVVDPDVRARERFPLPLSDA